MVAELILYRYGIHLMVEYRIKAVGRISLQIVTRLRNRFIPDAKIGFQ